MVIRCRLVHSSIEFDSSDKDLISFEQSDQRFHMAIIGHLYCENARSLDLNESGNILFQRLVSIGSPTDIHHEIAGGLFSLFIFDRVKQTFYVSGDRFGFKPLYYKKNNEEILLSPHVTPFMKSSRLLPECVDEFLSYGYLPYSDSLYEGLSALGLGETLKIEAKTGLKVTSHQSVFHQYPAPKERYRNLDEAVEAIVDALDRYYSRFGEKRYCLGLSGGYDSRLIATYLAPFHPHLINFGNPQSLEVQLAEAVARRLNLSLKHFSIPQDAVLRALSQWKELMNPFCDLSYAHVLTLVSAVEKEEADYYIDGFLGDTIIGSGYYYKLGKDPITLFKNLIFLNRYCSPIRDDNSYRSGKAVSDLGKEAIYQKESIHIQSQKSRCYTHEDMQEALLFTTRGRKLIASGPNAVSTQTSCLCPYVDYAVYDASMAISKELRAGNTLYNAIWMRKFPGIADIPKNDTAVAPNVCPAIYRLRHAMQAMKRRIGYPALNLLTLGRCDYREEYSSVAQYLNDPITRHLIEKDLPCITETVSALLEISPDKLKKALKEQDVMILRLLSLNTKCDDYLMTTSP